MLTEPRPFREPNTEPDRPARRRPPGHQLVALSGELAPWFEPLRAALGADGYWVVVDAAADEADVVLVTPDRWPALHDVVDRRPALRVVVVSEAECARHDHGQLIDAVNAGACAYVCGATPRLAAALIRHS